MHTCTYSRKAGPQAHGKAAYNSAECLTAIDGTKRDFTHKIGVTYTYLFSDQNLTRQKFWDTVEASEKRKDACTARGYDISLPIELTQEQNTELAKNFALYIKSKLNLNGIDLAIHYPVKRRKTANEQQENPHFHLLHPDRDSKGKKLNFSRNSKLIFELRQAWEDHVNKALETAGKQNRVFMGKTEKQIQQAKYEIDKLDKEEKEIKDKITAITQAKNRMPTEKQATVFYTDGSLRRQDNIIFTTNKHIITQQNAIFFTDGTISKQNSVIYFTDGTKINTEEEDYIYFTDKTSTRQEVKNEQRLNKTEMESNNPAQDRRKIQSTSKISERMDTGQRIQSQREHETCRNNEKLQSITRNATGQKSSQRHVSRYSPKL